MKLEKIKISKIKPNPWNPNEMIQSVFEHLKKEYERVGYLQPVVVRKKGKGFEVIDGEHRWRAAEEIGLETIDCIVVEMDDATAKTTSINLNKIKGDINPEKYAILLKELQDDFGIEELEEILNITETELKGYEMLLDLPEFPEEEEKEKEPRLIKCPNCGHEFEA